MLHTTGFGLLRLRRKPSVGEKPAQALKLKISVEFIELRAGSNAGDHNQTEEDRAMNSAGTDPSEVTIIQSCDEMGSIQNASVHAG